MASMAEMYQRQTERKIPTWLSIAVVLVVVVFMSFLFVRTEPPSTKASKKTVKRVELTNLSGAQVSLFWETDQKEPGWVVYGTQENKLDQIALDERDFQKQRDDRLIHYAVLKNLTPATRYYYKLVNEKELMGDKNGNALSFTTLGRTSQVSNLKPAYGKVTDINGAPLDNVVVLLSVKNARLLSAVSKSSGEWLIPLNYILDNKTNTLKILSKNEPVQIEFYSGQGQHSTVETLITALSPLPQTVILGKDYDLTGSETVLSATTENKSSKVDVIFPKENAIIPGNSPLIRGTGISGKEVQGVITNGKSEVSLKSTIGGDGNWSLAVDQSLIAGRHTLTIRTPDPDGKEAVITRNFTIAKSGEQVLGEATGAATPTASPSPTLVPQTPSPPVSGGSISFIAFSSLSLITVGLWMLVFAL